MLAHNTCRGRSDTPEGCGLLKRFNRARESSRMSRFAVKFGPVVEVVKWPKSLEKYCTRAHGDGTDARLLPDASQKAAKYAS